MRENIHRARRRFSRPGDDIDIDILRGSAGIGGTTILIERDGQGLLMDLGQEYSRWGEYYGPFQGPRSCRGAADLLSLGLLPSVEGLYRPECLPPGYRPVWQRSSRLEAILLSHCHGDHAQLMGYARSDLPIVCSAETAGWLRFAQETGGSVPLGDLAHALPRSVSQTDPRAIEVRSGASVARRLLLEGNPLPERLNALWNSPISLSRPVEESRIAIVPRRLAGMELWIHSVNHSTSGCRALSVRGSGGWTVYTGDLREGPDTAAFRLWLGSVTVERLIIEGTRLGRPGDSPTEEEVGEEITGAIRRAKGLAIVDLSVRNVERLRAVESGAHAAGRELVVTPRTARAVECQAAAGLKVLRRNPRVLHAPAARRDGWEQAVLLRAGSRLIEPSRLERDKDSLVLACGLYDLPGLIECKRLSGAYIYAGSRSYDTSGEDAMRRRLNWAQTLKLEVSGLAWEDGKPAFPGRYAASGHASEQELKEIVGAADAAVVHPVHTHEPKTFERLVKGTRSRVEIGGR